MEELLKKISFFILLFAFFGCANNFDPPTAHKGILDLRDVDFSKNSGEDVKLNGEWEIYWNELITPSDIIGRPEYNPVYFSIPHTWNGFSIENKELPGYGYATFRLQILLPNQTPPLALLVPQQNTSYRLYVNGIVRAEAGSPGESEKTTVPSMKYNTIYLPRQSSEMNLVMQVANYRHRLGGFWQPIQLGSHPTIMKQWQYRRESAHFLIGAFLVMSMINLVFYFNRRSDKKSLAFAVFTGIFALRLFITENRLITDYFPWISYDIYVPMEYSTVFLIPGVYLWFLFTLFPEEISAKLMRYTIILGIILSVISFFTGANIYSLLGFYYQFFLLIILAYALLAIIFAVYRKREGSRFVLISILASCIFLFNDLLYANQIIHTYYVGAFAILIYSLPQSLLISLQNARAFQETEVLKEDMEELNLSLNRIVEEKTIELQSTLNEIEKDLVLARSIQDSLFFKEENPDRIIIDSIYYPFMEIGGDYYYFIKLRENYYRFLLADATGHGIQAALLTIIFHSEYHFIKSSDFTPGEILTSLNSAFFEKYLKLHVFYSCFILDIDLQNNKAYYSSAGHFDQKYIEKGSLHSLSKTGPALGIYDSILYEDRTISVSPGGIFYLFTDGLFEVFDSKNEMLGLSGLDNILTTFDTTDRPPDIHSIVNQVNAYCNNEYLDDTTLLSIELKS